MSNLQFVKKLYNGKNCYSDHMTPEEIELLYLKSRVEDIVSEMISKNRIIFLTGNPGDGKTYIIKAIAEKISLDGVYVEKDLSLESNYDSVANKIIACYREGKPAIIAVNEYPFLLVCRAIKEQSVEIYKEIINKKMDKTEKKYPVNKAKGVATKYNKL